MSSCLKIESRNLKDNTRIDNEYSSYMFRFVLVSFQKICFYMSNTSLAMLILNTSRIVSIELHLSIDHLTFNNTVFTRQRLINLHG